MKTKQQMKDFKSLPNKKSLRIFLNERLNFDVNRTIKNKVGRISRITSDGFFFDVIVSPEYMAFTQSFAAIQSVSNYAKKGVIITYHVANNTHGYSSINSEIDFFRKFPESAEKMNLTVI